jgi:hypothetical protein
MSDVDTLNAFLQRTDLSSAEQAIKDQLLELDQSIKSNNQEREKLTTSLKEKEVEFLRLSGAFDAQLKLILSLAKAASASAEAFQPAQ